MRFQHKQFTKQIWIHKKHKKAQRELEVTQVFIYALTDLRKIKLVI